MKRTFYIPAGFKTLKIPDGKHERLSGHFILGKDENIFIWPREESKDVIDPENYSKIKERLGLEKITILDRVRGVSDMIFIEGHVNLAGYNYLIGKTPFGNRPTFPDISNIYSLPKKGKTQTVYTVGPNRFKFAEQDKNVISEWVGLVSPLWFYIGLSVMALGFPHNDTPIPAALGLREAIPF